MVDNFLDLEVSRQSLLLWQANGQPEQFIKQEYIIYRVEEEDYTYEMGRQKGVMGLGGVHRIKAIPPSSKKRFTGFVITIIRLQIDACAEEH